MNTSPYNRGDSRKRMIRGVSSPGKLDILLQFMAVILIATSVIIGSVFAIGYFIGLRFLQN